MTLVRRKKPARCPDGLPPKVRPRPPQDFKATLASRLIDKSCPEPNSGCWLWTGASQESGYGKMWNGSRSEQAHRIAYRVWVGEIPEGQEIDHKCRTPACVNPAHLRAVTHQQNMAVSDAVMGVNSRKTHCIRGHELAGENLRLYPDGSRQCRECLRLHARNAKARKRARNAGLA
jgi:hypothetical protein